MILFGQQAPPPPPPNWTWAGVGLALLCFGMAVGIAACFVVGYLVVRMRSLSGRVERLERLMRLERRDDLGPESTGIRQERT
jgi:hypothetical protein